MLAFWASDAVLIATQASLVMGPRPVLPRALGRLRSPLWAWLILPVSLGATILALAVVPGLGGAYAWIAVVGVPPLAAVAIGSALMRDRVRGRVPIAAAVASAAGLFALAWLDHGGLPGEAAATALTALSACTLASYVASLAPAYVLRAALVAMAILDAILVFGHLLQGPNHTLNAAGVGTHIPHLQVAIFGSGLIGYGDLFVAAVLGNLLGTRERPGSRWPAALAVLICSAAFDLLFLVVDALPATVPVALVLILIEITTRAPSHAVDNVD